jgi:hypothetical protein
LASAAAERVSGVAGVGVRFVAGANYVEFFAESTVGKASERVKATVTKPFSVWLNPELLTDGVRRTPTCAHAEQQSALVFRKPGLEIIVMLMVVS